jgi:hypothetical protein
MNCLQCSIEMTGRATKRFCSSRCARRHRYERLLKTGVCGRCGNNPREGESVCCAGCNSANLANLRNSRQRMTPEEKKLQWRRQRLMTLYGMSLEQFDAMRRAQNGKCACCGFTPSHVLRVDHCHATGKIRELLCSRCNSLVGWLELLCEGCWDKIAYSKHGEVILLARSYLAKHK